MPSETSRDIIQAAVRYHQLYPPQLDPEKLPIYISSKRLYVLLNYLEVTNAILATKLKQHIASSSYCT